MEEVANKKVTATIRRIRTIRESKEYSQDYLAAKLGISQNAYSKIELGYSGLSLERLFIIGRVLEVDVNALINEAVPATGEQAGQG